uniref:Uncharacterized protein n=1 Tax=uncultured Armatimonadetes bacterium TaxID=157466 RepID=A0A6J4INC1_9BACT|nr:hypothetical protein AVDCRST_MAG63-2317 [uncultured Armatimonadetes bacterium]
MRLVSLMRWVTSGGARAFTRDGFSDDICLVAARREAAGV